MRSHDRVDIAWLTAGFVVAGLIAGALAVVVGLVGSIPLAYAFGGMATTWLVAARLVYRHIE